MKMIEAIIKPFTLERVKASLSSLGITGITATEIRGFGRQRGHATQYRGSEYTTDFVQKIHIQVAVTDAMLQQATDGIMNSARTGEIGDGKIFVKPLERVVRIRTGEQGDAAV